MRTGSEPLLVVITHPADGADDLARNLVDRRLAACVQSSVAVRSTYRWKDEVEVAEEVRLELKTTRDRLDAIEDALEELHPYDVPELVAVAIVDGSEQYLAWVRESTRPES